MSVNAPLMGAVVLIVLLALVGAYAVVRLRKGPPPEHAADVASTSSDPQGDQDTIPQESGGGRPLAAPADPAEQSNEGLDRRARRNGV